MDVVFYLIVITILNVWLAGSDAACEIEYITCYLLWLTNGFTTGRINGGLFCWAEATKLDAKAFHVSHETFVFGSVDIVMGRNARPVALLNGYTLVDHFENNVNVPLIVVLLPSDPPTTIFLANIRHAYSIFLCRRSLLNQTQTHSKKLVKIGRMSKKKTANHVDYMNLCWEEENESWWHGRERRPDLKNIVPSRVISCCTRL